MMYLTRRQLLPSVLAWGYAAGNLPRPFDYDADQPQVHLCIPLAMCDTGHTHARVTYVTDHKLYRVEWVNL